VPNLEEAQSAFGRVVNEGHRAAQIITSIRAMFKKDSGARSLLPCCGAASGIIPFGTTAEA